MDDLHFDKFFSNITLNCMKKQIRYLTVQNFNCIVEVLTLFLVSKPQLYTEASSTVTM